MSIKKRITATELARGLSDVLNRVRYGNEAFVVERGGIEVCELRPARYGSAFTGADLAKLLRDVPAPGREYLDRVAEAIDAQPPAEDPRWEP